MKKIIAEKYESFKAKDLKNYSKIVNSYFRKKKILLLIPLLTVSCSVQNSIEEEEYKNLPKNFTVSFYDKVDTIKSISMYEERFFTKSFLKNFTENENINYAKPIELTIKDKELFLKFEDELQKQYVIKFYGKCYRKRFVFYSNYETITFPVLFMSKQMTKYMVSFTSEDEINIKKFHIGEGMLLMFGAGSASENLYRFKIL